MSAGRPSSYSEEIVERILSGLMEGQSLVKICDAEDMPNRRTVLRWMEANEEFATKCAHARALQADLMDDKILDLIDRVTPESAPADRIKLAALQWRASKLAPKKYGDKLDLKATHDVTDKFGAFLQGIAEKSRPIHDRDATKVEE